MNLFTLDLTYCVKIEPLLESIVQMWKTLKILKLQGYCNIWTFLILMGATQYNDDFRISSNGSNSIRVTLKFFINVPIQGKQECAARLVCQMFPMTFGQINGDDIRGSWVWKTWEVAKFSGIVNNIGKSTPFLMCKVEIFPFGFKKWKRLKNLLLNSCWDLEDLLGLVEHLMALKSLYIQICSNLKSLPPCLEKLKSLKWLHLLSANFFEHY